MTFPPQPINPNTSATLAIPTWCTSGTKSDPSIFQPTISETGWVAVFGQNYGPIPPYQWINWTQFQVGAYLDWLANPNPASGAIAYIKQGTFDGSVTAASGFRAASGSSVRFYETSNTQFVEFIASPSLSTNQQYTWPITFPTQNNQRLVASPSGQMAWITPNYQYWRAGITASSTSGVQSVVSGSITAGVWNLSMSVFLSNNTTTSGSVTAGITLIPPPSSPTDTIYPLNSNTQMLLPNTGIVYQSTGTTPTWQVSASTTTNIYLYSICTLSSVGITGVLVAEQIS